MGVLVMRMRKVVATGSGSYTTTFPVDENPISEGGVWYNSNIPTWGTFQSISGTAYGTLYSPTGYTDNYSFLKYGGHTANQSVTATLYIDAAAAAGWTNAHEFELLLRCTEGPNTFSCYECSLPYGGGGSIIRWNGANGDFLDITGTSASNGAVADGDTIFASIVGTSITFKHNGVTIATATDSNLATGQPGFGSFNRDTSGSGSNSKFGFKDITTANA